MSLRHHDYVGATTVKINAKTTIKSEGLVLRQRKLKNSLRKSIERSAPLELHGVLRLLLRVLFDTRRVACRRMRDHSAVNASARLGDTPDLHLGAAIELDLSATRTTTNI